MKLLGKRVFLRQKTKEAKTAGGIHIPDMGSKEFKGKILFVGKEVEEVSVGDNVMFGKHAGTPMKVGDEELLLMNESDILAVI